MKLFPIFIIAILVIGGVYWYSQNGGEIPILGSVSQGFFLLSPFSETNFVSNDADIGGPAWFVSVVQEGSGNFIVGNFEPVEIEDDGVIPEYPFVLAMDMLENSCQWTVERGIEAVYDVQIDKQPCNVLEFPFFCDYGQRELNCLNDHGTYWVRFIKKAGTTDSYCVYYKNPNFVGNPQSEQKTFSSKLWIDVNNKHAEGNLSKNPGDGGSTAIFLKDDTGKKWAYARWLGSLDTLEECPLLNDRVFLYKNDQVWHPVDKTMFDSYYTYSWLGLGSGFSGCLSNYQSGDTGFEDINTCIDEYNEIKNNAMINRPITNAGGDHAITTGTAIDGVTKLDLSRQITNPVIALKISADVEWLGFVQPVGQPKVDVINVPELTAGGRSNAEFRITNIGEADGTFDVRVDCDSPLSSETPLQRTRTLSKGAIDTLFFSIVGNPLEDGSVGCTIIASDVNNPDRKDTQTFSVVVSPITRCIPGDKTCNGREILECNDAGTVNEIIENQYGTLECPIDEKCTTSGYICAGGDDPDECEWWDVGCHIGNIFKPIGDFFNGIGEFINGIFQLFGTALTIVTLAVGSILVIVTFLFSKKFYDEFTSSMSASIFALVTAILVFILVWYLFLIGIILAIGLTILYVIARAILGGR